MLYVSDTSYEYAALAIPLSDKLKAAVSVIYLNYGTIALTMEDTTGVYTGISGGFTPYNMAVTGGLGYKLTKTISVGANLKYALEDIAGSYNSGVFFDAGIKINLEDILLGVGIYNLGSLTAGTAPMTGRAGLAIRSSFSDGSDLTLVGGVNYVAESGKGSGSVGAEYVYDGAISVRGSYELGKDVNALNAGVGLKSSLDEINYSVDYNLAFLGILGTAHRISLTVSFGAEKERKKSSNSAPRRSTSGIRMFNIK
jgi:hypothetical protein